MDEAIAQAVEIDVEDVQARVFSAEHLAAMALQTKLPIAGKLRILERLRDEELPKLGKRSSRHEAKSGQRGG
jgi:hypothetical protein